MYTQQTYLLVLGKKHLLILVINVSDVEVYVLLKLFYLFSEVVLVNLAR